MANETAELLVKISATTELLRQQMIAAENTVERTTKGMQRDLDKFDNKLKSVERAGFNLGSGLRNAATAATGFAAAIGVGTLVSVAREALDYVGAIDDLSQSLGISSKFLQEFTYSAKLNGASTEDAETALSKYSITLGKAFGGNKAAISSFEKLGLSLDTLRKSDDSTRFALIADAIAKIPEPTQRASAAVAIFGKGAISLIPTLIRGAAGFREQADAAQKLGIVLSDKQIQDAAKTGEKIDVLTTALRVKVAGVVSDNAASIDTLVDALLRLIDGAGKGIQALKNFDAFLDRANGSDKYRTIGKLLQGDFAGANQDVLDIGSGKKPNAPPPIPNTPRAIQPLNRFAPTPGRGPLKGGFGGAFGAFGSALTLDVSALLAEAAAIEQIGAKARAALPAVAGLTEELNALGRADLERPAGVDFNGLSGADQLRALVDAADERLAAEQDVNKEITADYLDRMNNATQFAASQFENLFRGGVGDVWDNFQRIGEQVIAQVAAKFLIAMLSKDGLSGAGGIGGILSSAFSSVLGFANGGNPPVGKVSMVGERGPELFIPRVPGTIISNDNLRGIGGGATQNITINAPGATAETVIAIRREIANAAPALIGAAKRETFRDARRGRL